MNIVLIVMTLLSLTLAGVMSAVAWKVARDEQRRSDARVAALEAEIVESRVPSVGEMFADRTQSEEPSPMPMPVALVVAATLILGTIGAVAMVSGSGSSRVAAAARVTTPSAVSGASAAVSSGAPLLAPPIELLSLDHQRKAGDFVIRGVVHNPVNGRTLSHLVAVVLLYNTDGSFAGTGRAPLGSAALEPGDETTFAVSVPGLASVGRYRVSFKTEDDHVVSHVDKRYGA